MIERTPFDYQVADATRLATDPACHGLAGKPGTGKSLTALLAAEKAGAKTILIFCPAVAVQVWLYELSFFPQWKVAAVRDMIVAGGKTPVCDVLVCGYEHAVVSNKARAILDLFTERKIDVMFCDEGHYLKNHQAKRTRLVYGERLLRQAGAVWPLSGTFMLNHPGELWPHLNALAPERIDGMGYWQFSRAYCEFETKEIRLRRGGRVTRKVIETIKGARREMMPDLKARLSGLFIPRSRDASLPPLQVVSRPIHASQCDTSVLRELAGDPQAQEDIRRIERALQAAQGGQVDSLREIEVATARVRKYLALAKVPAVVNWVADILENSDSKVIVWGWHTDALTGYFAGLAQWNPVMLRGDTPVRGREQAVRTFNTDPDCRVFVGQLVAAGTAITLNAADREVLGEMAFTPAINGQAIKRAHRIGQDKSVLAECLFLVGSVDEGVNRTLVRKTSDIATLDGAI